MKLTGKFSVIILALTFILASAYIANAAGMGTGTDQANARDGNVGVASNNPGNTVSESALYKEYDSYGTIRVDRDFGAFHRDDTNQFGDDRAYESANGHKTREADYHLHHWTPETYGLRGSYGRDSNN